MTQVLQLQIHLHNDHLCKTGYQMAGMCHGLSVLPVVFLKQPWIAFQEIWEGLSWYWEQLTGLVL